MATRDAPIKLKKVNRLDSITLDASDTTYFTEEGYLVDHPILTSCGIFEYHERDGSVRRELRLPDHVFNKNSLESYKGKPVIVTHDAGAINKDNVSEEIIGTILSDGYQDGEDVRAEIIIHDTDTMKKSGLKELSLGYNLDLVEEPGEWNGEKYDAIQTNIVINHLALVSSARAGDQARLNIDGSDEPTLKGGKIMKKYHRDSESDLSPEELAKAVALYKATMPVFGGGTTTSDEDDEEQNAPVVTEEVMVEEQDAEEEPKVEPTADTPMAEPKAEPKAEMPTPTEAPKAEPKAAPGGDLNAEVIAVLEKVVADLKAKAGQNMASADADEEEQIPMDETPVMENEDEDEDDQNVVPMEQTDEDDLSKSLAKRNCDSADAIVSQKLNICRIGDRLNLDGLEKMSVVDGKKTIIKEVFPEMRLDGKSKAYVNAAYDMAVIEVEKKRGSDYQHRQIFNGRRADSDESVTMAESARKRMLDREGGNN